MQRIDTDAPELQVTLKDTRLETNTLAIIRGRNRINDGKDIVIDHALMINL